MFREALSSPTEGNDTHYVAAVTTRATARDVALAFIRYLSSAAAREVFLATGAR